MTTATIPEALPSRANDKEPEDDRFVLLMLSSADSLPCEERGKYWQRMVSDMKLIVAENCG